MSRASIKLQSLIASFVLSAGMLGASGTASAAVGFLDSFQVTKNTNPLFFYDSFADGNPPPSSPVVFMSGPAVYTHLRGTFVEADGKLRLDTDTAPLTTSATGEVVRSTRATLATNINPAPAFLANGLKIVDRFSVTGIFDLPASMQPSSNFGVRLTDRDSAGNVENVANDVVDIDLRSNAAGTLLIRLREQDFIAHTATTFAQIALNSILPAGADQIGLSLSRNDTTNNNITGSFFFLDDGLIVGGGVFPISIPIFNGENYTRAEILMSAAVPEPETYAMLMAGLGLVGFVARRRKRNVDAAVSI